MRLSAPRILPAALTAAALLTACSISGTPSPAPVPPTAPPPVVQPESSSAQAVVPSSATNLPADPQSAPADPAPKPQSASVTIQNFAFSPGAVRVTKGATVTWTNRDSAPHQIDADEKFPSSPVLNQGQSYSYTFDETGTFSYYCAIHPSMKASVEVVP